MIERASPIQLRKALELANLFVKMGVNFVPVPVANDEEQHALVAQALAKLETMERHADKSPAQEPGAQQGQSSAREGAERSEA